jgi:ABC-2 type transport system permease protein
MLSLFLAELKRSWIQLLRYYTETLGGIFVTTIIFYGLFLSASYISGSTLQFGDRLDAIIVGYMLWTLVLFVMGDISGGLQREAQTGTLEQLFLSPFGAPRVFLIRAIASLTIQLTLNLTMLLVIMFLTRSRLSFPPTLLPPLFTVLLGTYGLAFIAGSISLLVKQVQQLLNILQFALLLLLASPLESSSGLMRWLSWFLPMVPGAGLLRDVMARQVGLDGPRLAIALLNGIAYFTLGIILFRLAERETKRRGKLGGY